jgi:hypothetical protein
VKLNDGGLFGDHDDRFVVASGMIQRSSTTPATNIGVIGVITSSSFWPRQVNAQSIGQASQISGVVSGPDTKYLLLSPDCGDLSLVYSSFFSVNAKGEVGGKIYITGQDSITNPLTGTLDSNNPTPLHGPALSGFPDAKYVVLWNNQILVINKMGEVWAHALSNNRGTCGYDTVGAGQKLSGSLFGALDDKYVVTLQQTIYVVNNAGEVWAHTLTYPNISGGVKLNGPSLFGGPDDKYVVTYYFDSQ